MKSSDALRQILLTPLKNPLPNGLEGEIATNIPLAIVMSVRLLAEKLDALEKALNYVGDEVSLLRKGVKDA